MIVYGICKDLGEEVCEGLGMVIVWVSGLGFGRSAGLVGRYCQLI